MDVDEVLAIQLHKQLNAIPLRRREKRGQDAVAQQSLERLKREKQGKPRSKRTNSSSQEHPSSRKRRVSDPDDDHGHTSSHQRMKREPTGRMVALVSTTGETLNTSAATVQGQVQHLEFDSVAPCKNSQPCDACARIKANANTRVMLW